MCGGAVVVAAAAGEDYRAGRVGSARRTGPTGTARGRGGSSSHSAHIRLVENEGATGRSHDPEVVPLPILPAPNGIEPVGADRSDRDPSLAVEPGAAQPAEWVVPAWDQVVRDHGDRVFRLAYRLSGNVHDAEDITQETFIRVFRSLEGYRPGSFEGWLHRITTNVFLDLVRRRQRIRMEALPEETERIAGREPSPEQAFSDANLDPDLQAALDDLHPDFRAAVVLCDVEGLSYEEIGATLGVKLGTVRSRIHRGRLALRDGYERRRAARSQEVGPGARQPVEVMR